MHCHSYDVPSKVVSIKLVIIFALTMHSFCSKKVIMALSKRDEPKTPNCRKSEHLNEVLISIIASFRIFHRWEERAEIIISNGNE